MSVRCEAKNDWNQSQCKNYTRMNFPYCWIHLKSKEDLQVKKSTIERAGKGLFYVGKQTFPKGKTITHYSSETITSKPNETSDYDLQISKNKYLDSSNPLNYSGRYINDGKGRETNVRFGNGYNTFKKSNRFTIPIKTTKAVKPHTELLINYGRKYWL